jgi:cysteine desulfurase / selenocysteine lyase
VNLNEVLSNEELRRHEFPVVANKIFLAHAGVAPLPRRVSEAVAAYVTEAAKDDQESSIFPAILTEGRKLASQLIHCQPEEVAFVGPTSLALSLIASGLKFRRGENVLIYFDDYPANVYPWTALAGQGVQVRLMNTRGLGVIRPVDVIGQVDENTRLVALASCHFLSGYRIEIDAIGKALRERGILFSLDGIQTLGAFPTTMENVDFMAADAHKWMLGPCGAGLMYVRRELQERVNPPLYGANNVNSPDFIAQEQIVFRRDARKFEPGSYNLLGIVGMIATMKMLLKVGAENIATELRRKRAWLVPALQAKGYSVLNADTNGSSSGSITSFFHPEKNLTELHAKLSAANVVASLRSDRRGQKYIRLSPHFYSTDAELQKVIELL